MRTEERITAEQATELSEHLGAEWAYSPPVPEQEADWRKVLTYVGDDAGLTGAGIFLSATRGPRGKWHICGHIADGTMRQLRDYILYDQRWVCSEGINVSATKPLAQIARDMQRRLLPEYLKAYREAKSRWVEAVKQLAQQNALALECAATLHTTVKPCDRLGDAPAFSTYRSNRYCQITVHASGTDISLTRLTAMQALELCSLMGRWEQEENTHA